MASEDRPVHVTGAPPTWVITPQGGPASIPPELLEPLEELLDAEEEPLEALDDEALEVLDELEEDEPDAPELRELEELDEAAIDELDPELDVLLEELRLVAELDVGPPVEAPLLALVDGPLLEEVEPAVELWSPVLLAAVLSVLWLDVPAEEVPEDARPELVSEAVVEPDPVLALVPAELPCVEPVEASEDPLEAGAMAQSPPWQR